LKCYFNYHQCKYCGEYFKTLNLQNQGCPQCLKEVSKHSVLERERDSREYYERIRARIQERRRERQVLLMVGIKDKYHEMIEKLSPQEKEDYEKFIVKYRNCPICGVANHAHRIANIFLSPQPYEHQWRELMLKYLHDEDKEVSIGIPCCGCYNKLNGPPKPRNLDRG
ncbi:MAG: hypothetical protein ACFFCS_03440, partial [Candidatus Hodarchaeota archaeon]